MEEKRKQMEEKRIENNKILQPNFKNESVNNNIITLRNEYETKLSDKNILINELLKKIKQLTQELSVFKSKS